MTEDRMIKLMPVDPEWESSMKRLEELREQIKETFGIPKEILDRQQQRDELRRACSQGYGYPDFGRTVRPRVTE